MSCRFLHELVVPKIRKRIGPGRIMRWVLFHCAPPEKVGMRRKKLTF